MGNQRSDIFGSCGEPLKSLAFQATKLPKSTRSDKIDIGPCVYFAANSEAIKIGFSARPFIRKLQLHPRTRKLWMIGVASGGRDHEGQLHQKFHHLRTPLYGEREWFRAAPDLIQFIDDLEATGDLIRWDRYVRHIQRVYRHPPPAGINRKSTQLLHGYFPQETLTARQAVNQQNQSPGSHDFGASRHCAVSGRASHAEWKR